MQTATLQLTAGYFFGLALLLKEENSDCITRCSMWSCNHKLYKSKISSSIFFIKTKEWIEMKRKFNWCLYLIFCAVLPSSDNPILRCEQLHPFCNQFSLSPLSHLTQFEVNSPRNKVTLAGTHCCYTFPSILYGKNENQINKTHLIPPTQIALHSRCSRGNKNQGDIVSLPFWSTCNWLRTLVEQVA